MRSALPKSRLSNPLAGFGLFAWVPLLLILATPLAFGGGDVDKGGTDRGDNPVVGSLPCMVDSDMNWMFWEPLGNDPNGGVRTGWDATIAFVGDDLDDAILDADGDPFGVVNDADGWTAAGSANACTFYLDRYAIDARDASSWLWTPSEYNGGSMVMSSPFGGRTIPLNGNALCIPLQGLSLRTGSGISVSTFRVSPGPGNPTLPSLKIRVTVNSGIVTVEYLP